MRRKKQQGSQLLHFPAALSRLHPFYSLLFLRQNSGRLRKLNDNKIGKISSIKDETFKSSHFTVHKIELCELSIVLNSNLLISINENRFSTHRNIFNVIELFNST